MRKLTYYIYKSSSIWLLPVADLSLKKIRVHKTEELTYSKYWKKRKVNLNFHILQNCPLKIKEKWRHKYNEDINIKYEKVDNHCT